MLGGVRGPRETLGAAGRAPGPESRNRRGRLECAASQQENTHIMLVLLQ
ncbi:hypothetical protein TcasGA2_TC007215 [Tribolium castaneum]|uniref:Uncharacterized protein n=1 Tax=Tribolium castaneum TaxID=7070 RepID=A0A139WJH9_TRICA|nr:hypothetical protein TcasGA2_TC007215 [Tribolium castaneum]